MVTCLIEKGKANADEKNPQGETPLHLAAGRGRLDVVTYLIEKAKVKVDEKNDEGKTPFHGAVDAGRLEVVKYLVDSQGTDCQGYEKLVSVKGEIYSWLETAAQKQQEQEKRIYNIIFGKLDKQPLPQMDEEIWKNTPPLLCQRALQRVIAKKAFCPQAEAKCLLSLIKMFSWQQLNLSPLVAGFEKQHANLLLNETLSNSRETLTSLIIQNCTSLTNIKLSDFTRLQTLDMKGCSQLSLTLIQLPSLITLNVDNTVLKRIKCENVRAFANYSSSFSTSSQENGVAFSVSSQKNNNKEKTNPISLHEAAEKGDIETVRYLIEEVKVNTEEKDQYGGTPLHRAVASDSLDAVEYLIKKTKVNVNEKNRYGNTALHEAVEYGRINIIKYLIEKTKINVNEENQHGNTPLHIAAGSRHIDLVKYLIENAKVKPKVNINGKNRYGNTALHEAAWYGRMEIVEYLIKNTETKIDEKNDEGKTPQDRARCAGHFKVEEYLINIQKKNSAAFFAPPQKNSNVISEETDIPLLKILLLGSGFSGCGSSSLLLQFTGQGFNQINSGSVGVEIQNRDINIQGEKIKLEIFNEPPQGYYRPIILNQLPAAKGYMLLFDVTRKITLEGLDSKFKMIKMVGIPGAPILLVGNKTDLESERQVSHKEGQAFAEKNGAIAYIETSAKTGFNVDEAFKMLAEAASVFEFEFKFNNLPQKKAPSIFNFLNKGS